MKLENCNKTVGHNDSATIDIGTMEPFENGNEVPAVLVRRDSFKMISGGRMRLYLTLASAAAFKIPLSKA